MPMYFPILTSGSNLLVGQHRIIFRNVQTFAPLPDITTPFEATIEGKGLVIQKTEKVEAAKIYRVYFELKTNPVPVMAIVVGVMVLLGLSLTIMIFDRVERVIDVSHVGELIGTVAQSPLFILGILAIVALFALRKLLPK